MSSASRIPPGHTAYTWWGAQQGTIQAASAAADPAGSSLATASHVELDIVTRRLPSSHTASTWFTGRLRALRKELEHRVLAVEGDLRTVRSNFASDDSMPEGVRRVKSTLEKNSTKGAVLWSVDSAYYSSSLAERSDVLGCSTSALCKAVLMETKAAPRSNAHWQSGMSGSLPSPSPSPSSSPSPSPAAGPQFDSRFLLVVVQYEA